MFDENTNQGQVVAPVGDTGQPGVQPFVLPDAQPPADFTPITDAPSAPALTIPTSDQTTVELPDTPAPATSIVSDDLLAIKQEALQKLSPLLDQLDQPPEERFKTTMMMIQASDDQTLIKSAYEAANNITDEKARAQALLDVVNEINYFSQQQAS